MMITKKIDSTDGLSLGQRDLFFLAAHPEMMNLSSYLRGTFRTCQADNLRGRGVELEEAYDHIFGANGDRPCAWCARHFNAETLPIKQAYLQPRVTSDH